LEFRISLNFRGVVGKSQMRSAGVIAHTPRRSAFEAMAFIAPFLYEKV
jgi:hypothetical protein